MGMIQDFLNRFIAEAEYEIIDDGKHFYAEIKSLRGVWSKGKTLEECRENLISALEGWLILRLRKHLPIPHFKLKDKPKRRVYA
jgi:predicted RNase H-like HicB family nuclease